ncbi:MAG: BatA domain-containing protein [Planctomycetota bacterium]
MNFLHPGLAAAGVAAVALPIVIHLLFRRRRVPFDWAAMELLREAVRRTNRRLKFEQWLVLALRSLAVLAAGLAIAVPFLGDSGVLGASSRTWMLVVDDGAASQLRAARDGEQEFARIRDEARAALATRGAQDRVGVVTASVPPRLVLAPTADGAAFEEALARIEPGESPVDLAGAIELARSAAAADGTGSAAGGAVVLVASAFRAASVEALVAKGEVGGNGETAPVAGEARPRIVALRPATDSPTDARVSRVEARPSPAGGAVSVRAVVSREGASLERSTVRVRATGEGFAPVAPRSVDFEAGQREATVEFLLATAGDAVARARRGIEVSLDADALAPGNSAFATVDLRPETEVGVVGRRGALDAADLDRVPASLWVARALSPAPGAVAGMRVREIDPSTLDRRALLGLDAVVVARPDLLAPSGMDALGAFVAEGGVAVVCPAGESLAQGWSTALFTRLGVPFRTAAEATVPAVPLRLAEEQPASALLSSVRAELAALVLPVEVTRVLSLESVSQGETVLALADGTPFVAAAAPRGEAEDSRRAGLVVALAAAPELPWTNLPVKPLMVPLFQELVRAGLQVAAQRDEVLVGGEMRGAPATSVRDAAGRTVSFGDDGRSATPVPNAGFWRGDAGTLLAANIDGRAIATAPRGENDVRGALASFGEVEFARAADEGAADSTRDAAAGARTLSFVLFVIALAALLSEGVLSRIFSHASISRAGRGDAGVATVGRVRARGALRTKDEPVGAGGAP